MVPSTILLKAEMGKAKEKVNCITYSGKKKYFSEACLEKKTVSVLICQSGEEVKAREAGKRQVGTRGTHASV